MTTKEASSTDPVEARSEVSDAVDLGRAATGSLTATGQAAAQRDGTEEENQKDAPGGSEADLGDVPKADYVASKPQTPLGLQAEPAIFASNGTLPENHVASNSGPVPVSAVASSPEHANELLNDHFNAISAASDTDSRQVLDDTKIDSMSAAELRAVAQDRGYDISNTAGKRGTRQLFRTAQKDDKSLNKA